MEEQQQKTSGETKKKILVVEDDKFLRDLIVQKLEDEGFDVSEAVNGEEGVKMAAEELPHIILLDLILPGMDGFAVMEEIRKSPKTKNIPIIILSNLGQKEDVERGLSLGATDFLIKAHFTPGEIIEKVKKTLLETEYFIEK